MQSMPTAEQQVINHHGGCVLADLSGELTFFASDSVRSHSDTDSSMVFSVMFFHSIHCTSLVTWFRCCASKPRGLVYILEVCMCSGHSTISPMCLDTERAWMKRTDRNGDARVRACRVQLVPQCNSSSPKTTNETSTVIVSMQKKPSQFTTQCMGDISHAFKTAKITVFDPIMCKSPDVPYKPSCLH